MKTLLSIVVGCSLAAGTLSVAAEKPAKESRASVIFVSPEKFTDFTTSGFGTTSEKDLKYLTELFTGYVEEFAQRYLAADERLELTFKDIDLAGRFEPERGPSMQDVRFIRDITFPRMSLSFRLLGPDGQVRREGERTLRDMNYNMKLMLPAADTEFRYDKELLRDWMAGEFKKKKN